jgi:hypothetical protein
VDRFRVTFMPPVPGNPRAPLVAAISRAPSAAKSGPASGCRLPISNSTEKPVAAPKPRGSTPPPHFITQIQELFFMIRIAFVVAIVSSMFLVGTASAAQNRASRQAAQANRQGPVKKLIELEKRKNEWLRQQFSR